MDKKQLAMKLLESAKSLVAEGLSGHAAEVYGMIYALEGVNALPYFSKVRKPDAIDAKTYASEVEKAFKKEEQRLKGNKDAAERLQAAFETGRRFGKEGTSMMRIKKLYPWLLLMKTGSKEVVAADVRLQANRSQNTLMISIETVGGFGKFLYFEDVQKNMNNLRQIARQEKKRLDSVGLAGDYDYRVYVEDNSLRMGCLVSFGVKLSDENWKKFAALGYK